MDANNSTRKYPSYTLAELEAFVAKGKGNDVMLKEIADRKSGASKHLVVPQADWKNVKVKLPTIGRM